MNSVYASLHHACADLGIGLFTISVVRGDVATRVYTSDPVAYPLDGEKPIADDAWSDRVMRRGETFVANRAAEFEPFFGDHAKIVALGYSSCANLPVTDGHGAVIATVNILAGEGHFTPEAIARYEALVARHKGPLMTDLAQPQGR